MDTSKSTTRTCSDCGQEYPLNSTHFRSAKDKSGKYYFQHRCISCARAFDQQRYEKADGAKKMRDWRKANPVKAKAAKRRTEARHPDTVKARKKGSHVRCKEKNNKRTQDWHNANRGYVREQRRWHYQEHREEIVTRVVQYQRDNPEQFRSVQHRRRARENGAEGSFSAQDIFNIYDMQDGRCAYCGITLHGEFEIEHIVPISRDGSNWPDNIVLACSSCNTSKGSKTPGEWAVVRGW